jgi:hypothetical protein
MNDAEIFLSKNSNLDIADTMSMLDTIDIVSEQDYETETTTWIFADKSKIIISNTELIVLSN